MLRVLPIHRCLAAHRGSWARLGHVSPNTPPFRPPSHSALGAWIRPHGQRRPLSHAKLMEIQPESVLVEEALVAKKTRVIEAPAASVVASTARKTRKKEASPKKTKSKKSALPPVEVPPVIETVLRPYQQECIDACLGKLKEGVMRQIVSLPVGSGKTVYALLCVMSIHLSILSSRATYIQVFPLGRPFRSSFHIS